VSINTLISKGTAVNQSIPSGIYLAKARERVITQWVESFWFEGLFEGELQTNSLITELILNGTSADRRPVRYRIKVAIQQAFGRTRILTPPIREEQERTHTAVTLEQMLTELLDHHTELDDNQRLRFARELQQTILLHAQSLQIKHGLTLDAPYHELESQIADGHRYHPCFKSRQGFDVHDNRIFGPEFATPFHLVWLAIRCNLLTITALPEYDYSETLQASLGTQEYMRLLKSIEQQGKCPQDYYLLPVHPWHWLNAVLPLFSSWLEHDEMLYLGEGLNSYLAQQSLRSLTPLCNPKAMTLKLPLAISNSSADRILSNHHTSNAPLISAWLKKILQGDVYLAEQGFNVLQEPLGITLAPTFAPSWLMQGNYGMLGAIWRDNPINDLAEGEHAVPMTALCAVNDSGNALLLPWLERHGVKTWLRALCDHVLVPLLHMMAVHGVLFEAHMQNCILIVRNGLPTRVLMRDLHGGMHFVSSWTTQEEMLNKLKHPPKYRNALNASTGFSFATPEQGRDYLLEVLLFIHFSEIAWHMHLHVNLTESEFWQIAANSWREHQKRYPEYALRFARFDVFVPEIEIERLAGRRLFAWPQARNHRVSNPMYSKGMCNDLPTH
jgi:2-[(L-alanin-3-ylcarbamoyl)methyl]-3-(2-aminoethylcarbamoyl)-2-hydroxypropanoate synthase